MSVPDVNGLLATALRDNSVSMLDFSGQIHGLKDKHALYLRPGAAIGVVLHNTGGLVTLPNLVGTWKDKEPNPPPSHLAIDQAGQVGRYVRLQYADCATENTNRHLSIELQAVANGDLTEAQVRSAAIIVAFANVVYGIDLAVSSSRTAKGVAHHSLFVDKGNPLGHFGCPGPAIIARKEDILRQARTFAAAMAFEDEPAGRWHVQVNGFTWLYTFDANGGVTWLDQGNKMTGRGTWSISAGVISFAWYGSATKETWNKPLRPTERDGTCIMKGKTYDVKAVRL